MGIKGLNKYIKSHCIHGCSTRHLSELRGLRIVVDASIYMYRYKGQDDLIGGIYAMVSLLEHHGLDLYFVFDGLPPVEKNNTIEERRNQRNSAQIELQELEKQLQYAQTVDIRDLKVKIQQLRRQAARLLESDIDNVKKLLNYMGIGYTVADGEADQLCVKLVLEEVADACLSDDTDMFLYKCPRVLRYLSIMNETVVHYDYQLILEDLNINSDDFCTTCVMAGTDYNASVLGFNSAMLNYTKYSKTTYNELTFMEWLISNKLVDSSQFRLVSKMYEVKDTSSSLNIWRDIQLYNRDNESLHRFLYTYGFLFAK